MLRQMRQRVILAAMLAFFAVILMVGVLVNIVNFGVVTSQADETLSAILKFEEGRPEGSGTMMPPGGPGAALDPNAQDGTENKTPATPPDRPFMELPDMESNYMTRFFVVRFDSAGNPVSTSVDYIASVNEENAITYAEQILQSKKVRGYLREYRYVTDQSGDNTVVVFLNTSKEQRSMRQLLIMTVVISCVSLLIVFVLVEIFAGRAIRPIANNIKQQKQFITDASHELKTPLTSISTSVDVLTMEHGEDEWTDNIKKQTDRMSKLVSELVALSRLDEDMPLPEKEVFNLSDAAWEIADVYQPLAKGNEKNLELDIEENVSLMGDRAAILQMLSVLLDNAVRYSDPKGDIRFCVRKKKNKVSIEVFNTCQYETPLDTDRLFDRFYRPDESRSTKTGGNGVGLSIAKAVAVAHGGKISASCPSGKTMTIRVTI
ncbi:MAG: HAMP domain-containing histidine kinase [Lachnospiraceae bacterium]|nr:HAMP domain-containing histidine kinase [Lachnospiraceae bacterium]